MAKKKDEYARREDKVNEIKICKDTLLQLEGELDLINSEIDTLEKEKMWKLFKDQGLTIDEVILQLSKKKSA